MTVQEPEPTGASTPLMKPNVLWGVPLVIVSLWLAGSFRTIAAEVILLSGVVVPLWLAIAGAMRRRGYDGDTSTAAALLLGLILVTPLYAIRHLVPLAAGTIADFAIIVACCGAGYRAVRRNVWTDLIAFDFGESVWLGSILPILFAVTWVGYAARDGQNVRFFGLYWVDFGNLLSIVNTLRSSPGLPHVPVVGGGPLGYHWLYFAHSAWCADLFGLSADPANAYVLSNLVATAALFKCMACTVRKVLRDKNARVGLAPWASGAALLMMSTLYFYQWVIGHTGVRLGDRNSLVLQLPHSLVCFGNNTFALAAALLAMHLFSVERASARGRFAFVLPAFFISVLPGYSITLLFPTAAAVVIGTFASRTKRWFTLLLTCASVGILTILIFRGIGLFSYGQGGGLRVDFDGGRFLLIVSLGFVPLTVIHLLRAVCARSFFHPFCDPLAVLCVIIPSFLMTRGTPTSAIDMSMKVASLYVVASAPGIAYVASKVWPATLRRGLLIAFPLLLGVLNTSAYAGQYVLYRALGRTARSKALSTAYYTALETVSRLPSELVVIDGFSIDEREVDPAVMLAGKRVAIASGYEKRAFQVPNAALDNESVFLRFRRSDYRDGETANELAAVADLLILPVRVDIPGWSRLVTFGEVTIYASTLRHARTKN